jgi:hypothetical protein
MPLRIGSAARIHKEHCSRMDGTRDGYMFMLSMPRADDKQNSKCLLFDLFILTTLRPSAEQ